VLFNTNKCIVIILVIMMMERGVTKWNAFKSCGDLSVKDIKKQKIEKPVLFQETLEELSRLLVEAYSTKSSIDITYYEQNQIYKINGIIIKIDTLNNTLKLESGRTLHFSQITDVES